MLFIWWVVIVIVFLLLVLLFFKLGNELYERNNKELCKSSEQNEGDNSTQSIGSVSGEHNTEKKCTCPMHDKNIKDKCFSCGGAL